MGMFRMLGAKSLGLGVAAFVITAAVLFPVFARARENARRSSCQSNLKQLALSTRMYVQDYDNYLPPVAGASKQAVEAAEIAHGRSAYGTPNLPSYGWMTALQPYFQTGDLYQCGAEHNAQPAEHRPTRPGYTDYWMNSRASALKMEFNWESRTILMGDGDGRDGSSTARYSKSGPPTNQYDGSEPAWPERHLGGANYSFMDGHVKWLRRNELAARTDDGYTFSP